MKAYVFPGQGSQRKGMGADLFEEFEDLTRTADSILGRSVKTLCLDDPDGLLDLTQYTQPALYVVNALSYYRTLRGTGTVPEFVAGHSLGEFNALLAAECFDFATGLRLVCKRGELMAAATDGGMAAVLNASPEEVRSILDDNGLDEVDLANFNTPSQIVISGRSEDIRTAQPLFETGNHLFMPLRTSGAFHSRLMEPARAEFARFLADIPLAPQKIPVISNVTARPHEDHLVKKYLALQMVSSVQWSDTVRYLLDRGVTQIEEIGHGEVLTKLVRKIRRESAHPGSAAATVPRPVGPVPDAAQLVRAWNERHPIGTRVRSTTGRYGDLETVTEATVLFGHRAAIYLSGHRGYFDLTEIEPVG